jgi:hypothetical protein
LGFELKKETISASLNFLNKIEKPYFRVFVQALTTQVVRFKVHGSEVVTDLLLLKVICDILPR